MLEVKRLPGVYEITNVVTGKRYIGSSVHMHARWLKHQSELRRGVHHSSHLQRAWDKHGAGAFGFRPLLVCPRDMLAFYEQRCFDTLKPEYNCHPVAGSSYGYKMPESFKQLVSRLKKGVPKSEDTRRKISESLKGRTGFRHTEESRARMSTVQKARPRDHLDRLHAAKRGVPRPDHVKAKIGQAFARLDVNQVKSIRALYAAGVLQKTLAAQAGISEPSISDIIRGATYKWVE